MKCSEALTILSQLSQRQALASPQQLQELCRAELVFEVDPPTLAQVDALHETILRFGMSSVSMQEQLDPSWLKLRLEEVEGKLKSGFSRGTSRKTTIWAWEKQRATFRSLIGVLSHAHSRQALLRASQQRPLLGRNPTFAVAIDGRIYAIGLRGQWVIQALSVRQARYQHEELHTFLKRFAKSEQQALRLKQAAGEIDANIGMVPKARSQIVIGLIKSGLTSEQAVRTYHQSKTLAEWVPYNEQASMAVNYVRGAPQLGGPQQVAARMNELMTLVQRARLGGGPDGDKRIARALLGVTDPVAGLQRARELLGALRQSGRYQGDGFKATARLLPTPGTPGELVHRVGILIAGLAKAQPTYEDTARNDAALSLAAAMTQTGAERAVLDRFLTVFAELERSRLPEGTNLHEIAAMLTPQTGTPTELAQTLVAAANRITRESIATPADYVFAASFIKRFLF